MATVREGNKAALVVVDVQVGVMREAWDASRVVGNVSRAVERARAENVPVIWVQHTDDDLPKESPQWQWVPELVPAEGEPRVHKQFNSSFEQTSLQSELAGLGVTHIVLAGAATNWCIRATAYGRMGMLTSAAHEYQAALKFAPDDGSLHIGLGSTYFAEHRYHEYGP